MPANAADKKGKLSRWAYFSLPSPHPARIPTTKDHLIALPPELRLMIYEQVFAALHKEAEDDYDDDDDDDETAPGAFHERRRALHGAMSLFHVNHQMRIDLAGISAFSELGQKHMMWAKRLLCWARSDGTDEVEAEDDWEYLSLFVGFFSSVEAQIEKSGAAF